MSVTRETEAAIQRACIQFLELLGCVVVRCNGGAVTIGGRFIQFNRTKAGSTSDLLACVPPAGRWVSVEVKAPGGRLTPDQGAFLDAVRRAGGVGLVVRSVAELQAALKAEGFDAGGGS